MNRDVTLVLVFVFLSASCIAAIQPVTANTKAPQVQWSQTYGSGTERGIRSMAQTSDGGYALSSGEAGIFFKDAWLVKTEATGDISPSLSPSPSSTPTASALSLSPEATITITATIITIIIAAIATVLRKLGR